MEVDTDAFDEFIATFDERVKRFIVTLDKKVKRFAGEYMGMVDQTFLVSMIFTTVGIYFHFLLSNFVLLIGLVTSIVGIRSIKPWNKMRRFLFLLTCELVTGASMFRLLDSVYPENLSIEENQSKKPWNKMGRLFLLMMCALLVGASFVRLLDTAHPVDPCVIMCVLWIVSLPFISIKFINYKLETDIKYTFNCGMPLSGFGILIIMYVASTFFGISTTHPKLEVLIGVELLGALLWCGFSKLIHNGHEDDEDCVLQTFYTFLNFISLSTFLLFLC